MKISLTQLCIDEDKKRYEMLKKKSKKDKESENCLSDLAIEFD